MNWTNINDNSQNFDSNSDNTILTVFPLNGLKHLSFNISKLIFIDRIPVDDFFAPRMNKWARFLVTKLKCPIVPLPNPEKPAFLIASEDLVNHGALPELVDENKKVYPITASGESFPINIDSQDPGYNDLVCRLIEQAISKRFLSHGMNLWKTSTTSFFKIMPENASVMKDQVKAYRGFDFKVINIRDGLYVAFDLKTRYVGRRSLLQYSQAERDTILRDHLDLKKTKRRKFLRDNLTSKFECRYAGQTGKNIREFIVERVGKSVYDYYRETYPGISLNPEEPAVFVTTDTAVPESRLFPIFSTKHEYVRKCSVKPQISPSVRYKEILNIVGRLKTIYFANQQVEIGLAPLMVGEERIKLPNLIFGGDNVLQPVGNGKDRYETAKIDALKRYGPFKNPPLPPLVLLYPDSLSNEYITQFEFLLSAEVMELTNRNLAFDMIRKYDSSSSNSVAIRSIKTVVESILENPQNVMFVCIMSHKFDDTFHRILKEIFKNSASQLFHEGTVNDIIFNKKRGKVETSALAVLTEAGVIPWSLSDGLLSDMHIGIDLLFGNVGYSFIYGKQCESIGILPGKNMTNGKYREALSAKTIKKFIRELLDKAFSEGTDLSIFTIHRDGRWWPGESEGLKEAVSEFNAEKGTSLKYAVVEILKSHFPVRMFSKESALYGQIINSPPGTFYKLTDTSALIVNTNIHGKSQSDDRTAIPLLINVAESKEKIEIEKILIDVYHLTALNWSAPRINLRLPVTIGWLDKFLDDKQEDETYE